MASSESRSSWRRTVSPVPSFLLRSEERLKKDKKETNAEGKEVPSSRRRRLKKENNATSEVPRHFQLSSHEKEDFHLGYSPFNSPPYLQRRYVFVMTKFSFWAVLGSLFFLGVLFFVGGFVLALYLVTSSPTFMTKFETKMAHSRESEGKWKGQISSFEEKVTREKEKIFHETSVTPAAGSSEAHNNTSEPPQVVTPSSSAGTHTNGSVEAVSVGAPSPTAAIGSLSSASKENSSLKPLTPFPNLKESPVQKKSKGALPGSYKHQEATLSPYTLEYGSFVTREEALKSADELIQKGYHPVIIRVQDRLQLLSFSVRCGNYQTRSDAVKGLQHVDKEFDPKVVRNNSGAVVVYP